MSEIQVIDFGSQYTFLIVKLIRKLGYKCEITNGLDITYNNIKNNKVKIIILSGGPASVYSDSFNTEYNKSTEIKKLILDPEICVVGICFGLQYICFTLGGIVKQGVVGEYGKTILTIQQENIRHMKSLSNLYETESTCVWMSHQDIVEQLPDNFIILGSTPDCKNAFVINPILNIIGFQFHPEVKHTQYGEKYFEAIINQCKCTQNWSNMSQLDECNTYLTASIPHDHNIVLGLSGGIDSTVVAFLLKKYVDPSRIKYVLIDHGMMRLNEVSEIKQMCANAGIDLDVIDMTKMFIDKLKNVVDPEKKRTIIGRVFIEGFEQYIKTIVNENAHTQWMLGQGTIYPDVVESAKNNDGTKGSTQTTIKSHHNVGGLPDNMTLKLVEPLRMLFKNEVKEIGQLIGVPNEILQRHPFPGPGLAIRIIGEITQEKIEIVQKADKIFIDALKKYNLYNDISQAYAGLLNSKSVGIVGDQRRYGWIICLRAVSTNDFMTANVFRFDPPNNTLLEDVATQIVNNIQQVSRVMYDITSKPPGTIELE